MNKKILFCDYAWITLSSLLTAIAVNTLFQFTGLAPGGITGLCIIFSTLTGIPVDIMSLCISIPLLILGIILLGKSFGIKTLYITFMTPLCMRLVPAIPFTAFLKDINPILELLIVAIIGGLLVGSAIGIALNRKCATGGTDLIALLIQHFIKFLKIPHILFVLDGSVVIASGVINQNIMIAVFSFISLMIIIKIISFITSKNIAGQENIPLQPTKS